MSAALGCRGGGTTSPPPRPPQAEAILAITATTPEQGDRDLDGYVVSTTRRGFRRESRFPAVGTRTATFAVPPGTYAVDLEDVAENCRSVDEGASRTVAAAAGQTVQVRFRVECAAIAPLSGHVVVALSTWLPGEGSAPGLFVLDPDGGQPRRLTTPTGGAWDNHPHVSADGKRIVYVRHDQNADAVSTIRIVNADGTAEPGFLSPGENPRWSPDGTRILFRRDARDPASRTADNDPELYLLELGMGRMTRLTDNAVEDHAAHWSR